jgi:hypothetical protein
MRFKKMKLIYFLILSLSTVTIAQKQDPGQILDDVVNEFNKVQDYEVDVSIKVDIEFLKVPESQAKIYFKQPDRISLKSDGFAMLPRNGFNFSPSTILKDEYTAIYEKQEIIDGKNLTLIKIIPLGTTSDVILSTLWIDEEISAIRKIESTTKVNGTFTIDFSYNEMNKYTVPSKMVFSFNIDKMNFPSSMMGSTDSRKREKKKPSDSLTKGKVFVEYSNYKINKGVPDSVFVEEKK